ncbi:bifunctional metallophosphatase/5'-nucleotidase [Sporomusa malonica]|uniref:2',3'-cyclic-nucleotide 2'-phosphodiesterase / 3'-nucleotidase n=1 Tax=Sporomusa malonica TaxID=112901 RepID=A0A1W2C532_9FIRM|nr:5'-nucleotidase C-terminal domain-containing protein [Sporomusa malonica]SMC80367.1 2',3'-cyclic-nucleotide 2'-phosphodiesterase / 3'-nucleotidase [Sporomusa malonica]
MGKVHRKIVVSKFKHCLLLISFMLSMTLMVEHVAAESAGSNDIIHLQILSVNDFHGALVESGKNLGAAKLAQFLKEAKAQNPDGTLLFSAGDMFQGSLDSNLLRGKSVVDVMNYAGFDAMTLGNHEFDWGIDILKQRIAQSKFPYVCANILDKSSGKPIEYVKPYTILKRNGVNIGVIGIATPETAFKTNPKIIANYTFADPAKTVNSLVPKLKQQGADVIVVLTHLASFMDERGNISGEAATLAIQAVGVDAIVSGHSHQLVSGKVGSVPVVQAGYNGRAVGKIELFYNKVSHKVESTNVSVDKLPVSGLLADRDTQVMLEESQRELETVKNVIVGHAAHALSHDRYELSETLLGQFITDNMRQATEADIAFQNTGGLRTGISAGTVTMGNLYEVLPFDNTLCTVAMTGKEILKVLEYGLMNDKVGMIQYSGIKVSYDAAKGRVIAVTLADGTQLDLEKTYKVVTNDFMAAGGDGFTMFQNGQNLHDTCIPVRDIVADAIRNQKVIDFTGDDRWDQLSREQQKDAA